MLNLLTFKSRVRLQKAHQLELICSGVKSLFEIAYSQDSSSFHPINTNANDCIRNNIALIRVVLKLSDRFMEGEIRLRTGC